MPLTAVQDCVTTNVSLTLYKKYIFLRRPRDNSQLQEKKTQF